MEHHTVIKCRDIVNEYQRSTAKVAELYRLQADHVPNPLSVLPDVKTRWWSTYTMLLRILTLKGFLISMVALGLAESTLTTQEWNQVELLCYLLEPFMKMQKLLEASKEVTISLVPAAICRLRKHLNHCAQHMTGIKEVSKNLLTDFNERWGQGGADTVKQNIIFIL